MSIYSQIEDNQRRTWLIMIVFTLFTVALAYFFGFALGYRGPGVLGLTGMFLIISGLMNLASYYWSDQVVMAVSGAKQIKEPDNPQLFHLVENLCIGDGLPMPKIYIVNDPAPNAFATGRDPQHAAVAVTTGLLEKLEKTELEGVIAHELSHVKNYDTRLMTVVVILVGVVAFMADFFLRSSFHLNDNEDRGRAGLIFLALAIVAAILAPLAAQLIQLAVSRRREFLADAAGAYLTRYPEGLASALEKIAGDRNSLRRASTATAHLYIENPLKNRNGGSNWLTNLFQTHPPVQERIAALRKM